MKDHYNAVRESDLYEYGGYRKSLLTQIAGLIIGPREEDAQGKPIGEPDKDEGWCVARQEILAAYVGCSVEEACREIAEFEKDGWLTVKKFVDAFGHERCHYTITVAQLKKIHARKMKREKRNGLEHPIRAKKPNLARGEKSRLNIMRPLSGKRSHHKMLETLLDQPSRSPLTNGQEAQCLTVKKPLDQPSIPVVEPVLPSLVRNNGHSSNQNPEKPDVFSSKEGKNGKGNIPTGTDSLSAKNGAIAPPKIAPTPPRPKRAPRMAAFKPEVASQFRAAGAPDIWFEAMAPLTGTIDMLNGENVCGCPFPVKAWKTVSENHPQWKASQLWVPKVTEDGGIEYSECSSLADQIVLKRMNESLTPEERERNAANFWFGTLDDDFKACKAMQAEMQRVHGIEVRWTETYDDYDEDTGVGKGTCYHIPNMDDLVLLYRAHGEAMAQWKAAKEVPA